MVNAQIFLFSYLIGSIPFGFLIGKLYGKIDVRTSGSGNTGATNIYRTLGTAPALFTFTLDMLKGFIPVFISTSYFHQQSILFSIITGLCVIVGHCFPIFLKFKGGKGVASAAGIFFALIPIPALISLVLFIIILKASKYVSLGSITAALALPATAYFFSYQSELIGFTILVALFVIITHKSNIKRLLNGTENRFNTKKKKI